MTVSKPSAKSESLTPASIDWYKTPKRPIAEILADLSKPIPDQYLDQLKDKSKAVFIPWYNAVKLLDRVTGGHWHYEITNICTSPDRIFITARITIFAEEGLFYREAVGTECLKREFIDKQTGEVELKEIAYGDPSSNAESMALRRAANKFGLGLYLRD
jgi:hypothetical protein